MHENEIPADKAQLYAMFGIAGSISMMLVLVIGLSLWAVRAEQNGELRIAHSKASQAEARITLAWLYAAEKTMYAQAKRYQLNLGHLESDTWHRDTYVIAFDPACAQQHEGSDVVWNSLPPTADRIPASTSAPLELPQEPTPQTLPLSSLQNALAQMTRGRPCRDPKTGFTAYAIGNLDDDPTYDIWMIDENKNLVNLVSDLTQ